MTITEESITRLKWIKLYRYLGYSEEEIKELLLLEGKNLSDKLSEKMDTYDDQMTDINAKRDILASVIKDCQKGTSDVDEYGETVEFWESEEMEVIRESLKMAGTPSLPGTIFGTFVVGAPICGLFINIYHGMLEGIAFQSILALISAVVLTLLWKWYLSERKYNGKRVKEMGKGKVAIFPLAIFIIIATLAVFVFFIFGVEALLAPEEMLFFEQSEWSNFLMVIAVMLLVATVVVGLLKKFFPRVVGRLDFSDLDLIYQYPRCSLVIWIIVMYCCFTNVTFVTENSIVRHTPLCPQGKIYSYEDVTKVEAKFGTKNISLSTHKRKGEFSYTIYFGDKKIVFATPYPNEDIQRYEDHTYLELEEFDEKLVKLGVEKISSDDCAKYCDLDKEYVDRFLRIVNNKG